MLIFSYIDTLLLFHIWNPPNFFSSFTDQASMDPEINHRQHNLTKEERCTPLVDFLHLYCLHEHLFDLVEMEKENPQEIKKTWLYFNDAGIEEIMGRVQKIYHPRLVRLFYQTLHKEDSKYLFTWDGTD